VYLLGIIGIGAPACVVGLSYAETLRDVTSSNAMRHVMIDTERYRGRADYDELDRSWLQGIDPMSNFAMVFGSSRGPGMLLSWAGTNLPGFQVGEVETHRGRETAQARVFFSVGKQHRVYLQIIVPHPTFYTMVEQNTLPEVRELEPPELKVIASDEIEINKKTASFYRYDKKKCSLLFRLTKHTRVNLWVKNCADSKQMLDVARLLDLERLEAKLDT